MTIKTRDLVVWLVIFTFILLAQFLTTTLGWLDVVPLAAIVASAGSIGSMIARRDKGDP